ncbi:hypothetical protein SN15_05965 [Stenotrophomonas maltophilia]|nr:hypothetical protein SN15_05965 [Stenotrophomonas maltophilia]
MLCLSTNAWAQVPDPDSELGEEMQTLVKNYVTEHPEVSIDDAVTRLAVQTEILQPMEDLRQEFSERLTAISIQQGPDQHILVELKGSEPVNSRVLKTASGTTRVVIETGRKHNEEEFYAIVDKHRDLLYGAIPGIVGTMGLPGQDLLVIHITGDEAKTEELKTTLKKLERVLGISLSLRPNMSKSLNMEYINGGAVLQNNNSFCTSGFPVKHTATGRKGITTAAHCPDALIYGNYGYPTKFSTPLTYVDGINDASHDVQWHTVGAPHTPIRSVYAASTSDYNTRSIMYMWTGASVGQELCFRGVRTGWSCGIVTSIGWDPGISCGPGQVLQCANTWIRVEGSALACAPGDSGAAVVRGNNGHGLVSKADSNGVLAGECDGITVMPWGAIKALGLTSG